MKSWVLFAESIRTTEGIIASNELKLTTMPIGKDIFQLESLEYQKG